MSLVVGQKLSKFYGADEIFSNITIEIPPKARIALVGPNGAGKTTLVNVIIGQELPTDGKINTAKDARVAYLPQRPELEGDHTLWDEQLRAFEHLKAMEEKLTALAEQMADPDLHDEAVVEYGALQADFEHQGGYDYETRIRMILTGVGFGQDEYDTPLSQLSGGQKTRAMLSRLLLEEPDVLILDEPTNHLDIQAVEWLENFLQGFSGAVLSVSHDRYFIDNFASVVWELEFKSLETYRGNYTHYLVQREERRERLQKEFEAQQAFIAKEQAYIRKHMGSRWTAQAKGRLKRLETMAKRGKIIEGGPKDRHKMKLRIDDVQRSGDKVLMTEDLSVGYDAPLFNAPDTVVYRGDTVAIIGANGAGKSTLLKTVIGDLPALSGEATLGAQVQIGYFAQAHELLDPDSSIIDEVSKIKPMKQSEARAFLAPFLFTGEDVFRPIHTLSGGERGRVALAKLSLAGANLLLLDEPTNHLDIDSQEILQAVLEDFPGTIIVVSHDRYLISELATQLWVVSHEGLEIFDGRYEEYIQARNQRILDAEAEADNKTSRKKAAQYAEKKHGLSPYELEKKITQLEVDIEKLEGELESISNALETASANGDTDEVTRLGEAYQITTDTLDATMDEWAMLSE